MGEARRAGYDSGMDVAVALRDAFARALGKPLPEPVHVAAHRLDVCGDRCAGDRVQAAYESGSAVAGWMEEGLR